MSRPTWSQVERAARLGAGLAVLWHEVFVAAAPDWELVAAALGLLGLPDMWRMDRRRSEAG